MKIPSKRTISIIQGFRDYANSSCDDSKDGPSSDGSPKNDFKFPGPGNLGTESQLAQVSLVKNPEKIQQ